MEQNYVFAVVSLLLAIGEGYDYQNRMTIQREHYSWPKGTEMSTHHGGRLTEKHCMLQIFGKCQADGNIRHLSQDNRVHPIK